MPQRFKNSNKNNNKTHTHKKQNKTKFLAEIKQVIKLFVCSPSFIYKPKLVAFNIMELKYRDFDLEKH